MRRWLLALFAAGGFALAVAPALGQDQSIGTGPDNTFSPNSVTVDVGDTVTITNTSMGNHNVHWDDRVQPEEAVSTAAWTTSRTFDTPGTYRFSCDLHKNVGMTATVVVRQPSTTTTTTTAPAPPPGTTPTDTAPSTSPPPYPAPPTTAVPDTTPPGVRARAAALRRRLSLSLTATERAHLVAVVRRGALKRTLRFVLQPGTTRRTLLRKARAGLYRITLTATDDAGNAGRPVHLTLRVRA